MARIALVMPAESGHLNPTLGVARCLRSRGHECLFFLEADGVERASAAGFSGVALATDLFPLGKLAEEHRRLGELSGIQALRFTVKMGARRLKMLVRDGYQAMSQAGVDLVIGDEASMVGASLARALGVPGLTLCNALPLMLDSSIPPPVAGWRYSSSPLARLRNVAAESALKWLVKPMTREVNQLHRAHGLPLARTINDLNSTSSIVAQCPKSFDFPRRLAPPQLRHAAPFDLGTERPPCEFPWQDLTGEPLVYISLGTLQNRIYQVFRRIAQALEGPGRQLVISLGGGGDPAELSGLAKSTIVVRYAPQTELLERASWCVTHAGMNTALECLAKGVPMLALPVTNDQPAVAARIAHHRVGVTLPLGSSVARLRAGFERLESEGEFRQRAVEYRDELSQISGADVVADEVARLLGRRDEG